MPEMQQGVIQNNTIIASQNRTVNNLLEQRTINFERGSRILKVIEKLSQRII